MPITLIFLCGSGQSLTFCEWSYAARKVLQFHDILPPALDLRPDGVQGAELGSAADVDVNLLF